VDQSQLQFVNLRGKDADLPPREGEETLDTEWASGIAPGATIRVYAAGSLQWPDIHRALDMIYADAQKPGGPRHLSLSFGGREDFFTLDQLAEAMFLKLAAIGVTTFVASGDAGSNPDDDLPQNPGGSESHVEYPASDRWVVAVGGTTLQFQAQGNKVISEIGWSGSGGGVSKKRPQPEWQKSVWPGQSNRVVPDVSSVADSPGAFIVLDGVEQPIWGTSWSAPMWAGFSALIAEAREKQGKPPLAFLAPSLYRLPKGTGFRDIVSGSNGAYQAKPGWDPVTGLGVPNVKELIDTLPYARRCPDNAAPILWSVIWESASRFRPAAASLSAFSTFRTISSRTKSAPRSSRCMASAAPWRAQAEPIRRNISATWAMSRCGSISGVADRARASAVASSAWKRSTTRGTP